MGEWCWRGRPDLEAGGKFEIDHAYKDDVEAALYMMAHFDIIVELRMSGNEITVMGHAVIDDEVIPLRIEIVRE